jgi:protein-tyrosine phosphatase
VIDIHSHVLWGLDDGAQTREQSIAMLEHAYASGTTDIVATPHFDPRYTFSPDLVDARIAELTALTGGRPAIHRACELHLAFDQLDALFRDPSRYTFNARQYLLLEFPDPIGSFAGSIIRKLLETGIIPVIAHPERNRFLQENLEMLEDWVEMGCLTQVTALCLTGGFGASLRAAAERLCDHGLVHTVASDAHDTKRRHTSLAEAAAAVRARMGHEAMEALFTRNPRHVIEGLPLSAGKPGASKRRWWSLR